MLLSPIQNTGKLKNKEWIQVRPRITQDFYGRPEFYKPLGLASHSGLDFGSNGDDHIFAPMEGQVKVKNDGDAGYGLHIKIRDGQKEVVLAHLDQVYVKDGSWVHMGDIIALMGNTGLSSAKHLHFALRYLVEGSGDLFSLQVKDYNNGHKGYVDPLPFVITWKGGLDNSTN